MQKLAGRNYSHVGVGKSPKHTKEKIPKHVAWFKIFPKTIFALVSGESSTCRYWFGPNYCKNGIADVKHGDQCCSYFSPKWSAVLSWNLIQGPQTHTRRIITIMIGDFAFCARVHCVAVLFFWLMTFGYCGCWFLTFGC